jgi:hypothetical protein
MKYRFRQIHTVEDILKEIGRSDIPSTEVLMTQEGNEIELDFGKHILTATDGTKLDRLFKAKRYQRLGKE